MSFERPYLRRFAALDINPAEAGIQGGWNMVPNGVNLPDISGNSNNGTIDGAIY